jgi:hypothetical protein
MIQNAGNRNGGEAANAEANKAVWKRKKGPLTNVRIAKRPMSRTAIISRIGKRGDQKASHSLEPAQRIIFANNAP